MALTPAAGTADHFVHHPLEHPADSIRLVKLEPAEDRDSEIECTIFTTPLDHPPPYVAVSYTWGDATVQRTIQINGKTLVVGYNSWEVLWQLRLHCTYGALFWMDMLCIDQTNDAEKSIQVGLMGVIYRGASTVFAGVGPHAEDSVFLAEQIHLHVAYIQQRRNEYAAVASPILTQPCDICGLLPPATPTMVRCDSCNLVSCKRHWNDVFRLHKEELGHRQVIETEYTIPDAKNRRCDQCHQSVGKQWYEHVEGGKRICLKCYDDSMEFTPDAYQAHRVRDRWGPLQGSVKSYHNLQLGLETWLWFTRMLPGMHQRINTALKTFSLRTYFTRLWVVQEIALSPYIIMACGDEIFPLAAFHALYRDSNEAVENIIRGLPYGTNNHRGWAATSWYMDTLLTQVRLGTLAEVGTESIAELVFTFAEWQCFDARDRLFALLAMADDSSVSGITPDYTQSTVSVLLRLLKQICIAGVFSSVTDKDIGMEELFVIISAFRLEASQHEIAALLIARLCHRSPSQVPYSQLVPVAEPPEQERVRIPVRIQSFVSIQDDEDGKLWAPLYRNEEEVYPAEWALGLRTAFRQACQQAQDSSGKIHSRGETLAIATGSVKAGDIALYFGNNKNDRSKKHFASLHTPCAGLVLRQTSSERYLIVGQIIFDLDVEPLPHALRPEAGRDKATGPSDPPDVVWEVHFAPEDLLLFIVQDLAYHQTPREHNRPTMLDCAVRPESTVKRLQTSVTADIFSSYATCRRRPTVSPAR
ncbi:hypothetical protein LTR62_001292 [Meristemomyces frigidus]|uniref:Heterokaryon incompatibility domain-containing protein n=1 Tax=Meristemomyces frigidus TaxID=1508187 RepID=A0AAN7YMH3_9PEZI|nr:hypothetical protein LTR62_001292 [Meristemomyces frigidus]